MTETAMKNTVPDDEMILKKEIDRVKRLKDQAKETDQKCTNGRVFILIGVIGVGLAGIASRFLPGFSRWSNAERKE